MVDREPIVVRDDELPERSLPAQKRSRERRERILEAAARVFSRVGIGGATMDAIAVEAGTSIGSLYRFFRDKEAIFQTLHESHFETARVFVDSFASEELLALPWEDVIRGAIDGFFAFTLSDPGFTAVWASLSFTGAMVEEGEVVNRELALRIAPLVERVFPAIPRGKLPVVCTVIVELVSGMSLTIARREGKDREVVMEELKEVMVRYLRPYATAPTGATSLPSASSAPESHVVPKPKRTTKNTKASTDATQAKRAPRARRRDA